MKDEYLNLYKKINSKNEFKSLVSVFLVLIIYIPLIWAFSDFEISIFFRNLLGTILYFSLYQLVLYL